MRGGSTAAPVTGQVAGEVAAADVERPPVAGDGERSEPTEAGRAPEGPSRAAIRAAWLLVLAALVAAAVIYGSELDHAFQFDSETKILGNPLYERPSSFLSDFAAGRYSERTTRFVANMTFALDYALYGWEAFGWHLTNLLLHLINVLLVASLGWALAARLGGASPMGVALGAAIFALHPLNSEAVNYCNARPNLLVTTFYLCTLLCALRVFSIPRPTGRARALLWAGGVVSLLLALLSKELALTLCLMAPMTLAWLWKGSDGRDGVAAARMAPGLGALAVLGLATVFATGAYVEVKRLLFVHGVAETGSWLTFRVVTVLGQSEVFLRYLGLALLPLPRFLLLDRRAMGHLYEHMYQDGKLVDASVGTLALPVASFLLLAIALVALIRLRWRAPLWTLLGLWPFVTHAPTSLLPRGEVMVEYRTYLPMVGVCLLLGLALERGVVALSRRMGDDSPRALLRVVSVGVCALLAAGTVVRNRAWVDTRAMWKDVVEKAPDNPRAYNSLGMLDLQEGKRASAMKHFLQSVRLAPTYGVAHGNIGGMLAQDGRYAEAIKHLTLATKYPPPNAEAHNNLANVLLQEGRFDDAIAQYDVALVIDPTMGEAIANKGRAYEQRGELDRALELYREAVRVDPHFAGSYYRLGALLVQRGQVDRGISLLKHAIALNPGHAHAHYQLGVAYYGRGDRAAARRHLERALALEPRLSQARSYLQALRAP